MSSCFFFSFYILGSQAPTGVGELPPTERQNEIFDRISWFNKSYPPGGNWKLTQIRPAEQTYPPRETGNSLRSDSQIRRTPPGKLETHLDETYKIIVPLPPGAQIFFLSILGLQKKIKAALLTTPDPQNPMLKHVSESVCSTVFILSIQIKTVSFFKNETRIFHDYSFLFIIMEVDLRHGG